MKQELQKEILINLTNKKDIKEKKKKRGNEAIITIKNVKDKYYIKLI